MKKFSFLKIIILSILLSGNVISCSGGGEEGSMVIMPNNLTFSVEIEGADANSPYGDGTGNIQFMASATDAVKYGFKIDTGLEIESSSGILDFNFTNEGTNSYLVTVFAYSSTNHSISSFKTITVYVGENGSQVIIPSNLTLTIDIVGEDGNNPNGDGTGVIQCTASAIDAVKYGFQIDTGEEIESSSGNLDYTFTNEGTNSYLVTVFAYSRTNHSISTSKTVTVFVAENGLQLVWSDEFDGNGAINTTKWFHQTQIPAGGNWYNGEIQHYTNREDNSYVSDGLLKIVAKKETFNDQGFTKQYTSARLNSKYAFTYGRVEVRAKLPTGVGTWPAIWMLGKNINETGAYWQTQGHGNIGWPACGEIDIMEHWGDNQNYVQSAMHTPSSFGGTVNHGGQNIPTASSEFHIYVLEWSSEKMVFSVDDAIHYTYNPTVKNSSTWPFDSDQYLLLNIAIQSSIESSFTQSAMEIDYVRVYK